MIVVFLALLLMIKIVLKKYDYNHVKNCVKKLFCNKKKKNVIFKNS